MRSRCSAQQGPKLTSVTISPTNPPRMPTYTEKGDVQSQPKVNPKLKLSKLFLMGDFIPTFRLLNIKYCQYIGLEAKNDKSKTTLFSQTFKVPKKSTIIFSICFTRVSSFAYK